MAACVVVMSRRRRATTQARWHLHDRQIIGNTSSVAVGTQALISHTYAANNGLLTKSTYGNGDYYEPEYDSLDRLVSESYNGTEKFNWVYGADGGIGLHEGLVNGVTWRYEYSTDDKLTAVNGSNGVRFTYGYDQTTGELTSCTVTDGTTTKTTTYSYVPITSSDDKKFVDYVTLPTGTVDYSYDDFYRASQSIKVNDSQILGTSYAYKAGAVSGRTSMTVEDMTNAGNGWSTTLSYTYDANGNIETISENGTLKATYHYDTVNQLVREDNLWLNKTIVYTYDKGGNIYTATEYAYTTASEITSSAITTNTYTYGSSNWKDKLTAYNGTTITYDEIGNPLQYYNGYEFTWDNGRQLASATDAENTITYKYDANGIRTQKTVNGVTTSYILDGSNVVKETNGTDTLWFYYDATGSVVSFQLNGTAYFYVKNLQGDIVAITNASGAKVVEYTYDSWGKLISTTGSLASTVGVKNPYRYRGYRYDTETGLYYLNSRYYDPEIKRFINADNINCLGVDGSPISYNLFTYCLNNPIIFEDNNGHWVNIVIGALIGGAIAGISTAISGGDLADSLVSAACGAISGGLAATGVGGLAGQMAIGAVTSAIDSGYQNYKDYIDGEKTLGEAITGTLIDTTMGAAFGAMGYDGTDALKLSNQITEDALDAARKRFSQDVIHPIVKKAAKKATRRFWHYVRKEAKKSLSDGIMSSIAGKGISELAEVYY